MELHTETIELTGCRHKESGKGSDDVTLLLNGYLGLADGQSNKPYSAEGGRAVLQEAADYMQSSGMPFLSDYRFLDEAQFSLICRLRGRLRSMAEERCAEPSDFASTLMGLAYGEDGNYCTVHLGDGVVIGIRRDTGKPTFISRPENGSTPNSTWLTSSKDAMTHLRFAAGNLQTYSRILMMSDGARALCRSTFIPRSAVELLAEGNREELEKFLQNSEPQDDATLIIADITA